MLSHWSEIANVLYIPLLVVTYLGWVVRFLQKWWTVMKWPDIALVCLGLFVLALMAVPLALPKVTPYFQENSAVELQLSKAERELEESKAATTKATKELGRAKAKLARLETQNTELSTVLKAAQDSDEAYRKQVDNKLHEIETGHFLADVLATEGGLFLGAVNLGIAVHNQNQSKTVEDFAAGQQQIMQATTESVKLAMKCGLAYDELIAQMDTLRPASSVYRDQSRNRELKRQLLSNGQTPIIK